MPYSPWATIDLFRRVVHDVFTDSSLCRVLAYVDAKMVKPLPERPLEGMITIHSEISPMASKEYELGR